MSRTFIVLLLLGAMIGCLAATAYGVYLPPPEPWPRFLGSAVFSAGKVHSVGGQTNSGWAGPAYTKTGWSLVDLEPMPMWLPGSWFSYDFNRSTQYAIYDPATDTWKDSQWQFDPQDPASLDMTGDGWTRGGEGTYPGNNQGLAFDALLADGTPGSDGVEEIWLHAGYPTWDGRWWVYNPPENKWRGIGPFTDPAFGDKCQYLGVCAVGKDTFGSTVFLAAMGQYWSTANRGFAFYYPPTPAQPDGMWFGQAQPPVGVLFHCGGVIGDYLYIAGGDQTVPPNPATPSATGIWSYQMSTGTWSAAPIANLAVGESRGAGCVYNGKLYIVGGVNAAGAGLTDVQEFDPVTNTCVSIGSLPMPIDREFATIDPATGTLYVGEGRHNNNYLDPTAPKWWKTDLDVLPLVFTEIAPNPCHFPWQSWNPGGYEISGTVTGPDGKPVAGAIVGFKYANFNKATMDARVYATTDGFGKYKRLLWPRGADWKAAAWAPNYATSADVTFTMPAGPKTVDLNLPAFAGTNLAPGKTVYFSSEDPGNPAVNAIDTNMWSRWSTAGGTGMDHYYIVDLGAAQDVTGVTIYWEWARAYGFSIDTTTDDPNPAAGVPAVWTTAYKVPHLGGGYWTGAGYNQWIDPITLNPAVSARGVRIHCTLFAPDLGNYSIWELKIHGSTPLLVTPTVAAAKALPDGSPVVIAKQCVVSGDDALRGVGAVGSRFWLEEYDRSSGIRVDFTSPPATGYLAWGGEYAYVEGTMATDAVTGERYIVATDVQTPWFPGVRIPPLTMSVRTELERIALGLDVKQYGRVLTVDAGTSSFTFTDGSVVGGSAVATKVIRDRKALPAVGDFTIVSGALSRDAEGPVLYEYETNGFITGWLLNGAYSTATTGNDETWALQNLNNDFLTPTGEAAFIPDPTDPAWIHWQGAPWNWMAPLNSFAWTPSGQNQRTVYAHVWVLSDADYDEFNPVQLWIGSARGYKLYINGAQINVTNVMRDWGADQDKLGPITLSKGWNRVMFKVVSWYWWQGFPNQFGLSARFVVPDPAAPANFIGANFFYAPAPW